MRVESRAAAGDASAGFTIVGVVAIGRNEGERLCRCLDSLPPSSRIVYVDSASTDDSVALALRRGAEVVELDTSTPFTAARARNAGFIRLRERWPQLGLVQFVEWLNQNRELQLLLPEGYFTAGETCPLNVSGRPSGQLDSGLLQQNREGSRLRQRVIDANPVPALSEYQQSRPEFVQERVRVSDRNNARS